MPSFLVVFTGQYLEGRAPMDVETAMSDALNLSLPQREKIFSGKPIVLKRTSDKAAALSLGQQLKAFGADIRIKIEQDDAVESTQGSKEAEQVIPAIIHDLRRMQCFNAGSRHRREQPRFRRP